MKSAIATAFSRGNFDSTYEYLAEDICWAVPGEATYTGKEEIIKHCTDVAAYFKTVTTKFEVHQIIKEENKIAVTGTAEFIRNGQRVSFVHGCDIYLFNDQGKLQSITSYCIQLK
ncbi:hypothetical protein GCM10027036_12120 [Flavihumibacter cheonanensis]|uniref:nuclear transport factor 2 family protein n=1 Tax=Flavihumibacter cheonanensis TaxID=1442385 RepID=UPI001EF92C3C|nr:nuclear transport factor 2 family protein [Flavihumibacter cheonanensis]MCG7751348.1 nuclear transport factor 2 family protein [Flavihumibacter cheonanensis]